MLAFISQKRRHLYTLFSHYWDRVTKGISIYVRCLPSHKSYKMKIGTHWYQFDLVSVDHNPPKTSFRALMYLKKDRNAAYEAFTAHPV